MSRLVSRKGLEMHHITLLTPLWAYFDPGSGSLVLQAVVGGAAGLFVFAKYLWTTAAPKFFRGIKEAREMERC
jgi:hypothetical protein